MASALSINLPKR